MVPPRQPDTRAKNVVEVAFPSGRVLPVAQADRFRIVQDGFDPAAGSRSRLSLLSPNQPQDANNIVGRYVSHRDFAQRRPRGVEGRLPLRRMVLVSEGWRLGGVRLVYAFVEGTRLNHCPTFGHLFERIATSSEGRAGLVCLIARGG